MSRRRLLQALKPYTSGTKTRRIWKRAVKRQDRRARKNISEDVCIKKQEEWFLWSWY